MPPTPPGLPAGASMGPCGGVLYVGDRGMLLHGTYGEKPVLIGEGATERAAAAPRSLPRILGGRDGHEMNWIRAIRGEEAIDAAERQHFDIALVDLYMTPISGMDVLRAITNSSRDTLVVVMTGNPTVASSLDALRAGAWDYLPKPFSASHLQVLVGRAAHAVADHARHPRSHHQARRNP